MAFPDPSLFSMMDWRVRGYKVRGVSGFEGAGLVDIAGNAPLRRRHALGAMRIVQVPAAGNMAIMELIPEKL